MKDLIKLKPSTASDIDTKKTSRWFRAGSHRGEIDQILDLYWGGPERRITGLTLKIIGLNFIALIILLIGVFYLGQYQNILVQSKLTVFETEIFLVSAALSQSDLKDLDAAQAPDLRAVRIKKLARTAKLLAQTLQKRILVFDSNGIKIVDTDTEAEDLNPEFRLTKQVIPPPTDSLQILKNVTSFILSLSRGLQNLPLYEEDAKVTDAHGYLDAKKAIEGGLSLSIWRRGEDRILLTAAMPVSNEGQRLGAVMLFSEGDDIQQAIGDGWFDIVKIFVVTFIITIFLSIYLSGVIARPLRKLAKAAENVRRGKADYRDIPDMTHRHDEIGELSIILRDMTHALWERMDSIESFAADVAHEIKNPLTSLKSAVETAHIVKKKEDLTKLLGVIQHDVERLDRLITDISHASRLDAELSRETFQNVDIKRLLRNLVNVYKSPLERDHYGTGNTDEAEVSGVKIRLKLPKNQEIFVLGSETRLMQVFQNIIANALSFSAPQTVISIKMEINANRATISFEDQGPGIPESKLKTVFDRFYSERPTHEDFGRHSGLGLSICKQIITAHNGVIFAENRADQDGKVKGARFVVILNTVS